MEAHDLTVRPAHLGLGATVETEPTFTGLPDWYADYSERHSNDGAEGRLVSMHTFHDAWDVWEMHPHGSELVLCTAGSIVLHQQQADGAISTVSLRSGEYAVNPPGIWHTADVQSEAAAVFITAGLDTQHRPR